MISNRAFMTNKDGIPHKNCICRNPELIENYDKAITDTAQTWLCHHRLETHTSDGERRPIDITLEELIALGMYYDRPPEELIFLTRSKHRSLHGKGMSNGRKGKHHTEDTKAKLSKAHKGKYHSEESKRKMSEHMKGRNAWNKGKTDMPWSGKSRSEETKEKISAANKGRVLSEDHKRKLSDVHKGKHWKLVNGKHVYY